MEYTTSDVARLLGVAKRTAQGYIQDGKLAADRKRTGLDWQYVVSREDLEQFAAKYEIPLVEEMPESSNQ